MIGLFTLGRAGAGRVGASGAHRSRLTISIRMIWNVQYSTAATAAIPPLSQRARQECGELS